MSIALPHSVDDLLRTLIGFDTVNDGISGRVFSERSMAEYMEALAQAAGFRTQRLMIDGERYNLLVTHETAPDKPWLIFESHMDTVAVDGMTVEPFGGEVRDGCIWGRGSCDTKGTGAAMFEAMRRYASGDTQPNNIALLFVLDEEFTMTGITAFVDRQLADLPIDPVGVIVGEPTLHKPVIAHNGDIRWRITLHGDAAHSSKPADGRSAIFDAAALLQAVETTYRQRIAASHPMTGQTAVSVNTIAGGSALNIIPDTCTIGIDRRLIPGETVPEVMDEFDAFLNEVIADHPGMKLSKEVVTTIPPLQPEVSEPFLPFVQQALSVLQLPTEAGGVPFGADAGHVGRVGIPAIILGPGDIAQAHKRDEFIAIDQLHQGVEVYHQLMVTNKAQA